MTFQQQIDELIKRTATELDGVMRQAIFAQILGVADAKPAPRTAKIAPKRAKYRRLTEQTKNAITDAINDGTSSLHLSRVYGISDSHVRYTAKVINARRAAKVNAAPTA